MIGYLKNEVPSIVKDDNARSSRGVKALSSRG